MTLDKRLSNTASLTIQLGSNSHNGHYHQAKHNSHTRRHGNEYGQSRREVKHLERDAVRACRRAVRDQAYNIGFRDVDFDDGWRARQIGPRGFRVHLNEVEFEGRRRDLERGVTCIVRRGEVRSVEGLPQPGRRGYQRNARHSYSGYGAVGGYDGRYDGFTQRQWRTYNSRHKGHNHSRGDYCPMDNGYRY